MSAFDPMAGQIGFLLEVIVALGSAVLVPDASGSYEIQIAMGSRPATWKALRYRARFARVNHCIGAPHGIPNALQRLVCLHTAHGGLFDMPDLHAQDRQTLPGAAAMGDLLQGK